MSTCWAILVCGIASCASALNCTGINAIKPQCLSSESAYTRDVFWIGGHYVETALGLETYDQMYVEKLTPLHGVQKPYPLVLFHGGGISRAVSFFPPEGKIKAGVQIDLAQHAR
jgi:hypothetical protein